MLDFLYMYFWFCYLYINAATTAKVYHDGFHIESLIKLSVNKSFCICILEARLYSQLFSGYAVIISYL